MRSPCVLLAAAGVFATAVLPAPSGAQEARPSPLVALTFLVGEWQASGTGEPGSSRGAFSFHWAAASHALVRYNGSSTPSALHADVMLIYASGDSIRATYADSEGHVIDYRATVLPDRNRVVFESAGPGARYRLWYALKADGSLDTGFQVPAPGAADFRTYLEGVARRRQP